jgi:hypothetical protein
MQGTVVFPTKEPAGHTAAAIVAFTGDVRLTDVEFAEVALRLVALRLVALRLVVLRLVKEHEIESPDPDDVKLVAHVHDEGRAAAFPAVELENEGHGAQVDLDALKKKFAAQEVHDDAPVEVVQKPEAHCEQFFALAADE